MKVKEGQRWNKSSVLGRPLYTIKIQLEILNKLGIEGNFLNLRKNKYKKPTANIIILNDEKLKTFCPRSGKR